MNRTREAVKTLAQAIAELDKALCQLPSADPDYDRLVALRHKLVQATLAVDARVPLVEKLPKPIG